MIRYRRTTWHPLHHRLTICKRDADILRKAFFLARAWMQTTRHKYRVLVEVAAALGKVNLMLQKNSGVLETPEFSARVVHFSDGILSITYEQGNLFRIAYKIIFEWAEKTSHKYRCLNEAEEALMKLLQAIGDRERLQRKRRKS